jgi:hypothetical protein
MNDDNMLCRRSFGYFDLGARLDYKIDCNKKLVKKLVKKIWDRSPDNGISSITPLI